MGFLKRLFSGPESRANGQTTDKAHQPPPEQGNASGHAPTTPATPAEVSQRVEEISSFSSHCDQAEAIHQAESEVALEWNEGDVILDRYEVRGVLGEGGMGRVYDVWHRDWSKRLAVKSPRPDFFKTERQKEDFTREAETWIDLGLHPHTVSCFYIRTLGGIPRVFAECIEGGNLKEWIESKKLYEGGHDEALRRILDIAIQTAWGLGFAHEKNLIHQDVKPANVMITSGGVAKVTDFGLTRARGEAGESVSVGHVRTILATYGGMTPAYCSPEQANHQTLTRRTDIWSWALSVLQMFIGQVAWTKGTQAPEVLQRYLDEGTTIEGPPRMPETLADLFIQCFEFEQEDRPHDFGDIAGQLLAISGDVVGKQYSRMAPSEIEARAGTLNNRGVSLWDLGRTSEAEDCFTQALAIDPFHLESTFNGCLLRWRKGEITDQDFVIEMERNYGRCSGILRPAMLLAEVHLERRDIESGLAEIEAAARRHELDSESQRLLKWATAGETESRRRVKSLPGAGATTVVYVTQDGQRAISAHDSTVRLWDLNKGKCLRSFDVGAWGVKGLWLSEDRRFLFAGVNGHDECEGGWFERREVLLLDVDTGRLCWQAHAEGVSAMCVSRDGRWAVSTGRPGLCLWETATGKCVRTFGPNSSYSSSVTMTPDAARVLSGDIGNRIFLAELPTGKPMGFLSGHTNKIESISVSPDGCWAISGSADKTVRFWDLSTLRCINTRIERQSDRVISVSVSGDSRWAVSACANGGELHLWELPSGRCVRVFRTSLGEVLSVQFIGDTHYVLCGGLGNDPEIMDVGIHHPASLALSQIEETDEWLTDDIRFKEITQQAEDAFRTDRVKEALTCVDLARDIPGRSRHPRLIQLSAKAHETCRLKMFLNGWHRSTLSGHEQSVLCGCLGSDEGTLLSGSADKTIRYWDILTGRQIGILEGHEKGVSCVRTSSSGELALSGSTDKTVRLWDVRSGECICVVGCHPGEIHDVAMSADTRWALSGGGDGSLRLWDLCSRKELCAFQGHKLGVSSISVTSDFRFAASSSLDNTICLWNVVTGVSVGRLKGHSGAVKSVSISPDGTRLLSGSTDRTVRLWDVISGECLRTMEGHTKFVLDVCLSSDSRWAISASADETLRLWDLNTGKCVQTFLGHTGAAFFALFAGNTRRVLSWSSDGTVRTWELDWDFEFPGWADWDAGAQPYLESFLTLHGPCGNDGLSCIGQPIWIGDGFPCTGQPTWTEENFQALLIDLQHRGYGWLRPEGVRKKLEEMANNWVGPPPLK